MINTNLSTHFGIDHDLEDNAVVETTAITLLTETDPNKVIAEGNRELERISITAADTACVLLGRAFDFDPKYQARVLEVAAQLANTAVGAIKQRQDVAIKQLEKSKITNQTNNLILDRTSLLDMIKSTKGTA